MHEILDTPDLNIVGIELSDTLTEEDYESIVTHLEDSLESHTTTRLFFDVDGVEGWEPEALWEDLAFDIRYVSDLDKVAIVGDDPWEPLMEKIELLFPMSYVQTFHPDDQEDAWQWLRGDMEVPGLGPGSVPDPEAGAQDEEE